jgi:hypothetical protein
MMRTKNEAIKKLEKVIKVLESAPQVPGAFDGHCVVPVKKPVRTLGLLLDFLKNSEGLPVVCSREAREAAGLVSMTEAARVCRVDIDYLHSLVNQKKIPRPSHKLPGHKIACYALDEVETIRALIASRAKAPTVAERRRADGFFSVCDVAAACGVRPISIAHHTGMGRIAPPTHKYPLGNSNYRYYSRKELEAIQKLMKDRKGFCSSGQRGRRAA